MTSYKVTFSDPGNYILFFSHDNLNNKEWTIQKHMKRSTKYYSQNTVDLTTRIHFQTGNELRYSGSVNSSCSTSGTCRVTLVTKPVICHKWGKDWIVITTNGTHPWCDTDIT